jgi:hypothetical protein
VGAGELPEAVRGVLSTPAIRGLPLERAAPLKAGKRATAAGANFRLPCDEIAGNESARGVPITTGRVRTGGGR